jgi:sec-independent protein translocase protein TatA
MFGSLGMPELILILVIALIVFGPKKLPEVGRSLGKAMREFKRTTEEIKGKFEEQINAEEFKDIKNDLADIKKEVSGTLELPNEIKELTRDLTPERAETGATGAGATPDAPLAESPAAAPSSTPEATPVAAPRVEPPAPADSSAPADAAKDETPHGEG